MANSQDVAQLLVRVNASTELLKRNLIDAERAVAQFQGKTEQQLNQVDRRFATLGQGLDRFRSSIATLGAGVVAGLGVASIVSAGRAYLDLADRANSLQVQLKLATAESGNFAQAQEDVARIAGATRSGLEETASLYANFVRASRALGESQDGAARAAETFSKALKIGGADAASAASATLQFGQALASGVLRGDEFNSIAEASPRILKLISESLGVTQGALRAMAADGKLSADVLYTALTDRKFTAGIDAEFNELPVTFGQAMTQVSNAALTVFGEFDRGGQFSKAVSNFVSDGTGGFSDLGDSARNFGIEVHAVGAGLADAFDPLLDAGRAVFSALGFEARSFGGALHDEIYKDLKTLDDIANAFRHIKLSGFLTKGKTIGQALGIPDAAAAARFEKTYQDDDRRRRAQVAAEDLEARFGKYDPKKPFSLFNASGGSAALGRTPPPVTTKGKGAGKSTGAAALTEYERLLTHVDILSRNVGGQLRDITYDPADYGGDQGLRDGVEAFNQAQQARLDADQELLNRQEQNVRTLANLYEGLFEGGTGNIFATFKRLGFSAVSEVLAKFTASKLSGGVFSGLLGSFGLGPSSTSSIIKNSPTLSSGLHFAAGGVPPVGLASLVGERGPELFIPKVPGTIVPNSALKGGGNTIHVNVDARGASDPQSVQRAVELGMAQAYIASVDHTNDSIRGLLRDRL